MLAFSWLYDSIFAIALYLVAIAVAWHFLYRTRQQWVVVSAQRTVWIFIRLLLVIALFYGTCAATGFAMWVPLALLVGLAVLSLNGQSPVGYPSLFVWIVVLHFVLGFPDTGELILKRPKDNETEEATSDRRKQSESRQQIVGRRATTMTALRPIGKLQIDGIVYDARTELGRFIEADTEVLITNAEKPCVLVRELST
jgi:membrane-bound ClpP family serine protease